MSRTSVITLMTDFGDRDAYVGSMKGVILSINPDAKIVDITHRVPSFNLASASYLLSTYYNLYPGGAVHVAVVDPGVGGARDAVVLKRHGYLFVVPDNGIVTAVLEGSKEIEARRIENPELMREGVSATFHGRDVFAPCAARLAAGFPFDDVGSATFRLVRLESAEVSVKAGMISGAVAHIDRFGNYITNITAGHIGRFEGAAMLISIGEYTIVGLSSTYSDRAPGELVAYIGSTDRLEVGVTKGRAADVIGLPAGAAVSVRSRGGGS